MPGNPLTRWLGRRGADEPAAPAPAECVRAPRTSRRHDTVGASKDRSRVDLSGQVVGTSIEPGQFEAVFDDGTGQLTLVWLAPDAIPGIEVGAKVRVRGFRCELDGRPVIHNPRYDLL